MDFSLSDDRRMLADTLDRFLRDHHTLAGRTASARTRAGHDETLWRQLAELGALGAMFAPEDGGFGGDPFDLLVVFEAFGRALVAEPFLPALMSGRILAGAGAPQLAELVSGERLIALAHEEPAGSEDGGGRETIVVETHAGYRLTGFKTLVLGAPGAGSVIVSATFPSGEPALLLVDAQNPGLSVRPYVTHDGLAAGDVTFGDVMLDAEALLARDTGAEALLADAIAAATLALCAEALGIMEAAKDMTLDYLRTRIQFGAPIGRNQALQHRMAEVLIEIEQSRSATINAAAAFGDSPALRDRALAAAKYTIGTSGTLVGEEAIQLHGGIGMTDELALSHYAKRLILIDHYLGDADHHLDRVISAIRQAA